MVNAEGDRGKTTTVSFSPLREKVGRASGSDEGLKAGPAANGVKRLRDPSSGASRHLLPQGEKDYASSSPSNAKTSPASTRVIARPCADAASSSRSTAAMASSDERGMRRSR